MAGRQVPTCSTCSSQASCRPRGSGLLAWSAGWPPGRCSPSPSSFPHRTSGAVQTTSNFQVLIALLKALQGFCKSSNFLASCLKCIELRSNILRWNCRLPCYYFAFASKTKSVELVIKPWHLFSSKHRTWIKKQLLSPKQNKSHFSWWEARPADELQVHSWRGEWDEGGPLQTPRWDHLPEVTMMMGPLLKGDHDQNLGYMSEHPQIESLNHFPTSCLSQAGWTEIYRI